MELHAAIKKQYLDMILTGAKKTEYRDMSEYWGKKILDLSKYGTEDVNEAINDIYTGKKPVYAKPYDTIVFHCDKQVVRYQIKEIKAYDRHKLFAIQLGKRA